MPHRQDETDLERLLAQRCDHLMRAAIALAGSRQAGEDLLQAALERVLRNSRRSMLDPEGYLRRTLYNLAADGWRRGGRWRLLLPLLGSQAAGVASDEIAAVDLRDALARILQQLPPRQRAVIMLRFWEQLTEAETAALLGCSEGTVKSASARGLRRLRELAALGRRDPRGAVLRAVSPGRAAADRRHRRDQAHLGDEIARDGLDDPPDDLDRPVELPAGAGDMGADPVRRREPDRRLPLARAHQGQPRRPPGHDPDRLPPGAARRPAGTRLRILHALRLGTLTWSTCRVSAAPG